MAFPVEEVTKPAALTGQANGKLTASILRTVNRVTMLADSSIRGWLALQSAAAQVDIILGPTSPADTYRTYAQQETLFRERYVPYFEVGVTVADSQKFWQGEYWWRLIGEATAAVPGRSNHGLALAIDVAGAQGDRLDWLLAHAGAYGFSWELQSEPWHIHYYAGDNIPAAVLAYESGGLVTIAEDRIAEMHLALMTGDRAAAEAPRAAANANQTSAGGIPIAWLPKQYYEIDKAIADLASDVAETATDLDTMKTDIASMKTDLADIKALLIAGGGAPGTGPTAQEIADATAEELKQRLEE